MNVGTVLLSRFITLFIKYTDFFKKIISGKFLVIANSEYFTSDNLKKLSIVVQVRCFLLKEHMYSCALNLVKKLGTFVVDSSCLLMLANKF